MILGGCAALEALVCLRHREIDRFDEEIALELLSLLLDEALGVTLHTLGALFRVGEETLDLALACGDEGGLGGGGIGIGVLEVRLVLLRALLCLLEHLA